MPGIETCEALFEQASSLAIEIGGRVVGQERFDRANPRLRIFEVTSQPVVEESSNELTDAGLGFVEGSSVTQGMLGNDGVELAEKLEAAAGRALADSEGGNDSFKGDGIRLAEEKTVNLSGGPGKAESVREVREVGDQFVLGVRQ